MNPDLHHPFAIRLARAFLYAFRGIRIVSRDRMFRCQLIAGVIAIALGAWLKLSGIEWAILALTIAGVLAMEAMNSAIETTINLVMPTMHPMAGKAKDVAAGAVLLASFGAIAVGLIVLGPKLWSRF